MLKERIPHVATVGVADFGNSAILVTVTQDGRLLDRRRVDFTRDMPIRPYLREGSWALGRHTDEPPTLKISLDDAVALVSRVSEAAAKGAREGLDMLLAAVPLSNVRIAIRICPKLPATIVERIINTRAAIVADSVMYREALATAAEERGWRVHWYRRGNVFREAAAALGVEDIDAYLHAMGRSVGPPWNIKHRAAAAAAIAMGVRRS